MPTGTGGTVTHFGYDANGQVITMYTGGDRYFYIRNGQGDITGLVDEAGNQVVEYKYYTWGAMRSTTGTLASTIGKLNPFRYRGYFYDDETKLYYVGSRYYDPQIRRWISPDAYVSTGQGLLGSNMYLYCGNNTVNRFDAINWPGALRIIERLKKFGRTKRFIWAYECAIDEAKNDDSIWLANLEDSMN